ncbi:MAG: ELM1/GtrOC1 family putative glycosyltransferase [Pseudomonadota bacterium]|nr:ELM1/GtrOC1 family putative glycosyltransferase [Pseudomonadota bacterium]
MGHSTDRPVILVLTDGRAGHVSKTQGMLLLLAQLAPYADHRVQWWSIRQPQAWQRRLSRGLLRLGLMPYWCLRWYVPTDVEWPKQVSVVVSTGGDTLVPNVLLSQLFQCQNLVSSALRGIPTRYFSVVFSADISQLAPPYLCTPIAPTKMQFAQDTGRGLSARQRLGLCVDRPILTLLIGADTRDCPAATIDQLIHMIDWFRRHTQCQVLLTTSRRTPISEEQALQQQLLFEADDQCCWVAQGQQCHVEDYIDAADWVICTQESESMLSEVISVGRPLIVPQQDPIRNQSHAQRLMQWEQRGWLWRGTAEQLNQLDVKRLPKGNRQDIGLQMVASLADYLAKVE